MIAPTRRAALGALSAFVLTASLCAQAPPRPQPYAVTGVSLDRTGADDSRWTLILRDGRIEQVQPAGDALPPGLRVVDGSELLALPAFLDAFTRTGVETPAPVKDQDVPVDEQADVRIDMREANRKGIQPAFRAVEALALDKGAVEAWNEAGFGAALVAPGGELLAGTSVLAAAREAAARDVVVVPDVFQHAAFAASGDGYPSTLMGYHAQLRQFFLDAQRHAQLVARQRAGQGGVRPAWDDELDAAAPLLAGEARLVCEAQTARDLERWVRLGDELGFQVAISGGRDVWKRADLLAERGIPVVLTLDWGEEVDDPSAKEEPEEPPAPDAASDQPGAAPDEAEAAVEPPDAEPDAAAAQTTEASAAAEVPAEVPAAEDAKADAAKSADETSAEGDDAARWIYEAPLAVRAEERRLWEEKRDGAIHLHEAGVAFAFGSAAEKPGKLLGKVREVVEAGLPADVALEALTRGAASLLGVERRLGRLEPGYDATLVLWTADPLTDEKAKVAWTFVDGFPREFELEKGLEGAPAEGVDLSGTWTLEVTSRRGTRESTAVLEMSEDGAVSGTLTSTNPGDDSQVETELTGHVAGHEVRLEGRMQSSQFSSEIVIKGTIDGDSIEGKYVMKFGERERSMDFRGSRPPKSRELR